MKVKDVAYIAAALGAGFVAFRVYKMASAAVDSGVTVGTAIAQGVKKVVTEDLNPVSDKNVIYSGISSVVTNATGQENSLGTWLYNLTHADENLAYKAPSGAATSVDKNDDFRRAEIVAENAQAVTQNAQEALTSDRKTSFRLSELYDAKPIEFESQQDRFLKALGGS